MRTRTIPSELKLRTQEKAVLYQVVFDCPIGGGLGRGRERERETKRISHFVSFRKTKSKKEIQKKQIKKNKSKKKAVSFVRPSWTK